MAWFIGAVDSIGMRDETRRRGVAVQPHAPFELEDAGPCGRFDGSRSSACELARLRPSPPLGGASNREVFGACSVACDDTSVDADIHPCPKRVSRGNGTRLRMIVERRVERGQWRPTGCVALAASLSLRIL